MESRTLSVVSKDDRLTRNTQTPTVAELARRPQHPSILSTLVFVTHSAMSLAGLSLCITFPKEDSCL